MSFVSAFCEVVFCLKFCVTLRESASVTFEKFKKASTISSKDVDEEEEVKTFIIICYI